MHTVTEDPQLHLRRSLTLEELARLDEPAVIREYAGIDSDGVKFFAYTVAGWLDGENVATWRGGCTVGGTAIVVTARNQGEADYIAGSGLQDTIDALKQEQAKRLESLAALARLEALGAKGVMQQAIKSDADKSDAFIEDMAAIRPLRGTDIALAAGRIEA